MLEYTGERMVPEASDENTFWEHAERYRFAVAYAKGRRTLDIACGEGYGTSAILRGGGTDVVGVDISEEACSHARDKYGLNIKLGSAENIPLPDKCVDLVVSFETIEHLKDMDAFVNECSRVLDDDGQIVISTPNLPVYTERPKNPFHEKELTLEQFETVLAPRFQDIKVFGQCDCNPVWLRFRGGRRLWKWLQLRFGRKEWNGAFPRNDKYVEQYLISSINLRDKLSPYRIASYSRARLVNCCYLLAVGRKRTA